VSRAAICEPRRVTHAHQFCLVSAGAFFLVGLLAGAWKYAWIARTADGVASAPVYVDVAHRASLLYAFACMLLGELCARSAWSDTVDLIAAIVLVALFAAAVAGYVVHGVLRDTDNQLRRPHQLGKRTVRPAYISAFMIVLTVGEIGAFVTLFAGVLRGIALV
jgi:hypothetical protein